MNQEQNSQLQESQPPKNHSDKVQQLDCSQQVEVSPEEVKLTVKIMAKLKKIQKIGKLSDFKQRQKCNRQLFQSMSDFFLRKKNLKIKQKEQKEKKQAKANRIRYNTRINQHQISNKFNQPQQGEIIQKEFITTQVNMNCYTCHQDYKQIHYFYGKLCPNCANFNWQKRTQTTNMSGLTALVTGARIKIGYQIALKLLRDGAKVYATSRFAKDCLLRYQKEKDYNLWKERLFIMQCDFLSQSQVAELINYIKINVPKLDILINNAAQTLVRPKQFYTLELKNQQLFIQSQNIVSSNALQTIKSNSQLLYPSIFTSTLANPADIDTNQLDVFGQPIDKRTQNSWVQKIEDVPLMDCFTTQVINSIVPFYLISQLKYKMIGSSPSWIINVSSMQGIFNRKNKQQFHPHTNMSKAALNMITRTSACEFKNHNIFMNSIDTGWITNQNPYNIIQKMNQQYLFKCPLDCIDGAMRVLDPIYQGLIYNHFTYGLFIKDYKPSNW